MLKTAKGCAKMDTPSLFGLILQQKQGGFGLIL